MGKDIIKYEEQGFFSKIRSFFSNLFKKKNFNNVQPNLEEQGNEKQNCFRKNIEIKSDDDELKIIDLQKQYKAGEIKEEDMTDDEHKKLIELYKKQNYNLKNKIETKRYNIKMQIDSLKA